MPLAICKANSWPEEQYQLFSTVKSELWGNAGQSALQMQKAKLTIDKNIMTYISFA